ncbi:MAG: 1-phosphofructokinase family hexose kinase [Muriicola sp.]
MSKIITITVNPAIDKSTTVDGIRPNSKLRCAEPVFDAGGGGINVSRAIKKLGGSSLCIYLAGGSPGTHLHSLLEQEEIEQQQLHIKKWTRENLSVTDTANNHQYRFGMPGPVIEEKEWQQCLELLEVCMAEGDYVVASGSLAPGVPVDFYARIAQITQKQMAKFILDTSGEPLLLGAKAGVYLLKPNLGELSALCGVSYVSAMNIEDLAKTYLKNNSCEVLVISMGPKGALLVTRDHTEHIPAPVVHQRSTIGAGDSMVGGMVLSMAQGKSMTEMARYGVACGTAATMNPGTQLCKKENVDTLYQWILSNQIP